MTSGGNEFNDFHENQRTKFAMCIYLLSNLY